MNLLNTLLLFTLTIFLTSCGNDGLGMKIEIKEVAVPAPVPAVVAEVMTGNLKITVAGVPVEEGQLLVEALAAAFAPKEPPEGELTFTRLSVRNRTMEHPSRGSGEIDATCVWTEAGDDPIAFDVRVRTYSIALDNQSQLKYLRDEALTGMVAELADELW